MTYLRQRKREILGQDRKPSYTFVRRMRLKPKQEAVAEARQFIWFRGEAHDAARRLERAWR